MRKLLITFLVVFVIAATLFLSFRKELYEFGAVIGNRSAFEELCKYEDGLDTGIRGTNDPFWEPNNKFGIYIYAEEKDYFELAQNLVNSNGGEWGYVLIPYNIKDLDNTKWERVFDQLRAKKLIPIVQLWGLDYDSYEKDTKKAADFLNSFVWPIKYRYISVYNEPNSADFWFGRIAPAEYAQVLNYTIDIFKQQNQNFFMMNAGFNTSAGNDSKNMDAFDYMKKMNETEPGIFEKLDGWASHSYPQPNFSGNPHNVGRWSIKAYETELNFLKEVIGVNKYLPVFITETGWAHAEGENYNNSYLPGETVSAYFITAYNDVWLKDEKVRAVMPFTVWYKTPFDHFSWVNEDKVPYDHYNVVKSMKKIKGKPPMLRQGTLMLRVCNVAK